MDLGLDVLLPWLYQGLTCQKLWTMLVGHEGIQLYIIYLQLAKVLNPAGASARLSAVDVPSVSSEWQDYSQHSGMKCEV